MSNWLSKYRDLDSYQGGGDPSASALFDSKYSNFLKKANEEAKKYYPGKKVEVKEVSGYRKPESQADIKKRGQSTTDVSLHAVRAARDFQIFVDGKPVKKDSNAYHNILWKNAEKEGLYHLDPKGFGAVDLGHIGVIEEDGVSTYGRLLDQYPQVTKTAEYKQLHKFLTDKVGKGNYTEKEDTVYKQLTGKRFEPRLWYKPMFGENEEQIAKEVKPNQVASKIKKVAPKFAHKKEIIKKLPLDLNSFHPYDTSEEFDLALQQIDVPTFVNKETSVDKLPLGSINQFNTNNKFEPQQIAYTGKLPTPTGEEPIDNRNYKDILDATADFRRSMQTKYQKGGKVSKTGYRENSKDKHEPFLNIPAENISMKGVRSPILAIADTGMSQFMVPPYDYYFPGATIVREFPLGKMQNGGLWNTNKQAYVDSVMNANSSKNFIQRYLNPNQYPVINNPDGSYSTHLMAYDKNRVYPTIVQDKSGKLINYGNNDNAWNYADTTGEYIQFPNEEQASWFASSKDNTSGYKMGKQKKQVGGKAGKRMLPKQQEEVRTINYIPPLEQFRTSSNAVVSGAPWEGKPMYINPYAGQQEIARTAEPQRSAISKAGQVARHPMTAVSYMMKGQPVPDYLEYGEKNVYDNAADILNPLTYYDAGKRVVTAEHYRNPENNFLDATLLTGLDAAMSASVGKGVYNKFSPKHYTRVPASGIQQGERMGMVSEQGELRPFTNEPKNVSNSEELNKMLRESADNYNQSYAEWQAKPNHFQEYFKPLQDFQGYRLEEVARTNRYIPGIAQSPYVQEQQYQEQQSGVPFHMNNSTPQQVPQKQSKKTTKQQPKIQHIGSGNFTVLEDADGQQNMYHFNTRKEADSMVNKRQYQKGGKVDYTGINRPADKVHYQTGGDVKPFVTSDSVEYQRRQQLYEDSSKLYNTYIQKIKGKNLKDDYIYNKGSDLINAVKPIDSNGNYKTIKERFDAGYPNNFKPLGAYSYAGIDDVSDGNIVTLDGRPFQSSGAASIIPVYKQPVQQVIYQPNYTPSNFNVYGTIDGKDVRENFFTKAAADSFIAAHKMKKGGPIEYTSTANKPATVTTTQSPGYVPQYSVGEQYMMEHPQQYMRSAEGYGTPQQQRDHEYLRNKMYQQEAEERDLREFYNSNKWKSFNSLSEKFIGASDVILLGSAAKQLGKMSLKALAKNPKIYGETNILPHDPYSSVEIFPTTPTKPSGNFPAAYIKNNPTGKTGKPKITMPPELKKEQKILESFGVNPREIKKSGWPTPKDKIGLDKMEETEDYTQWMNNIDVDLQVKNLEKDFIKNSNPLDDYANKPGSVKHNGDIYYQGPDIEHENGISRTFYKNGKQIDRSEWRKMQSEVKKRRPSMFITPGPFKKGELFEEGYNLRSGETQHLLNREHAPWTDAGIDRDPEFLKYDYPEQYTDFGPKTPMQRMINAEKGKKDQIPESLLPKVRQQNKEGGQVDSLFENVEVPLLPKQKQRQFKGRKQTRPNRSTYIPHPRLEDGGSWLSKY